MEKKLEKRWNAVPFSDVTVSDSFWAPRMETCRRVSIPHAYNLLKKSGCIDALRLAWKLGDEPVPHVFWDSDVAKWLEAACYSLSAEPDAELRKMVDEVAGLLAAAQQPDGYLNSHYSNVEPDKRWTNLRDCHELYCAGHLMEAAVAHHQATGERTLLDVLGRYADHIGRTFGREPGKKRGYPGHEEIELALVKLYRATGERRHLELAQYFVDERGRTPHYYDEEAAARGEDPKRWWAGTYEYCQAHKPVREQTEPVGHSVRAMYLYSGMADIAAETGDETLLAACRRLWENVVECKMYVTGGVGARHGGEAFGANYELPNDTAYAETCAAIGLVFWAHRMLQMTGDGRYADVMERALYNGVLSGVSLDGTKFFYVNPLTSAGTHLRQEWFGCPCCPTNIVRMLTSLGSYIYSGGPNEMAVHLYVTGQGRALVAGQNVVIEHASDYPWKGDIRLTIRPERPARFCVLLRVPDWCPKATIRINGKKAAFKVQRGYARISRAWLPGDAVELTLDMPIVTLQAHPSVTADQGRVAIQRGPIVYCLEQADHRSDVWAIALAKKPSLTAKHQAKLLGGVTTIQGRGLVAAPGDWRRRLYRAAPARTTPQPIKAIPYYAWANRKPGPMVVWLNASQS